MKIIAIMPIKLNNERLPGKNTMSLEGKPLLQHQLLAIQQTGLADEIYVYCSDEAVCPYLPADIHFLKRPAELHLILRRFSLLFLTQCLRIFMFMSMLLLRLLHRRRWKSVFRL